MRRSLLRLFRLVWGGEVLYIPLFLLVGLGVTMGPPFGGLLLALGSSEALCRERSAEQVEALPAVVG